ncbi:MAG: hypothetical protein DHS20C13_26970 [Thermodesulfobacteriota bacterium]|nr:MAG: hypothetical protein DHS20C13_26970 [Thermodesulfobacteriota bacterium]
MKILESLRKSFLLFLIIFCCIINFGTFANAFNCLPTCTANDARFLTFGGQDRETFVFETMSFGIGSPEDTTVLEIGIFDGESDGLWDEPPSDANSIGRFEYTLFADPEGDGTGTFQVGQWSSDGSFGENTGGPMPDNDWFRIFVDNTPEAQAVNGNFLYFMIVKNLDTNLDIISSFKIRSDGTLFLFPTDQPFGYAASLQAPGTLPAAEIVYPDTPTPDFLEPSCNNNGFFCDTTDPSCCLFGTTYDGSFSFFLQLDRAVSELNFWDGDFDFGPKFAEDGPPFIDTDDPNTPEGIPVFADVQNTNPQTSAGAQPPDDHPRLGLFVRSPNIIYELVSPEGDVYRNDNPSATAEWELFQLSTKTGCEPDICDIQVSRIPAGIWEFRIIGGDLDNLNFLRINEKIVGVNEEGDPVPPLPPTDPVDPESIPTMSEWGMLAVVFFFGILGIYHLRKKKSVDTSSS